MSTAQKFAEAGKFLIALGSAMFFLALTLLFGFMLIVILAAIL